MPDLRNRPPRPALGRSFSLGPPALAAALGASALAPGDTWQSISLGAAAAADDQAGRSVAIGGGRIAVGVPERDFNGVPGSGAVAIFERGPQGPWAVTDLLGASDAAVADVLGQYVSIDQDLLLVGAANDGLLDPAAPWTGAGYLFRRDAGGWGQVAKFLPPDPIEFHEFGLAGDVDEATRTVSIGARLDGDRASRAGSVYVFTESPAGWGFRQELYSSDPHAEDLFGFAVALDGDTLAVATPATDDLAESSGSVELFVRNSKGFSHSTTLLASNGGYRDQFGFAVDLEGDTLVVGAPRTDHGVAGSDRGSAYVFRRKGTAWSEVAELRADPVANLMGFGNAVAIRGGTIAVGASSASFGGGDGGAVFVFREIDGAWTQVGMHAGAAPGLRLGTSVATDGVSAVAGEPDRDQPASNAGGAWVRTLPPPCVADLDGDGTTGPGDLSVLLGFWTLPGADLDGDGTTGPGDLTVLLGAWGPCPS